MSCGLWLCDMSTSTPGSTGTVPIPMPIRTNAVRGHNRSWVTPGKHSWARCCVVFDLPQSRMLSTLVFFVRALLCTQTCRSLPCRRHSLVLRVFHFYRRPQPFSHQVTSSAYHRHLSRIYLRSSLQLPTTHHFNPILACFPIVLSIACRAIIFIFIPRFPALSNARPLSRACRAPSSSLPSPPYAAGLIFTPRTPLSRTLYCYLHHLGTFAGPTRMGAALYRVAILLARSSSPNPPSPRRGVRIDACCNRHRETIGDSFRLATAPNSVHARIRWVTASW